MPNTGLILLTNGKRITPELAEQAIALDEISSTEQESNSQRKCVYLDPVRGIQPKDGLSCDDKHCPHFADCKGQ